MGLGHYREGIWVHFGSLGAPLRIHSGPFGDRWEPECGQRGFWISQCSFYRFLTAFRAPREDHFGVAFSSFV